MANKWYVPDGFTPSVSNGATPSHEAICILNTTDQPATISLTLYFTDREKLDGFTVVCPAERTVHVRMDSLKNSDGKSIPLDTPYAIMLESESDLTMQYTRVDSSQTALALATTVL